MHDITVELIKKRKAELAAERVTLRICGTDVQVIEGAPGNWARDSLGRSSTIYGQILLREDLPPDVKLSTLLHEVVHCISDMNDLTFRSDERDNSVLANSLFAFIRDNKSTIQAILNLDASCKK